MRQCIRQLAILCLGAVLALPVAAQDEPSEADLEKLQTEISELKRLLRNIQTERDSIHKQLEESETSIGKLQTQIRGIKQEQEKQEKKLKALKDERQSLNRASRRQKVQITRQIEQAYVHSRQNRIKLVLNQQDPEKISRGLAYFDYLNQARHQQLENYADTLDQLARIEPEIEAQNQALASSRDRLERRHSNLRQEKSQRQSILAKLNSTISDKNAELRQLGKDRAELEKLLAAVGEAIANMAVPSNYSPFASQRGKLPWPVSGRSSNRYNAARDNGGPPWKGLNIRAQSGSVVKAIHHGRVVYADWLRGSGLLLILDHGDGYMSLYAHNESLLREIGDWVVSGDPIATVGNSGGQDRAGLYFEIRHNGKPQSPSRWCRA